jgi:hypothetical protein
MSLPRLRRGRVLEGTGALPGECECRLAGFEMREHPRPPSVKGEQGGVKGRRNLTQQRGLPDRAPVRALGDHAQRDLVGDAKGDLLDTRPGRGLVVGPALVQHRVDLARVADRAAGEGDGHGALFGIVSADRGGQFGHAGSFCVATGQTMLAGSVMVSGRVRRA